MIQLENLTLGYADRTLIEGINTSFEVGRLTALIGRNGSGKSTLLRAIAGLGDYQQGAIRIGGERIESLDAHSRSQRIAFVTTERVRIANLRCRDVVALGRAPYTNWIGRMQEEDRRIVEHALKAVGMASFADRTMDRMSDGECQRVMIARALAQQTPSSCSTSPPRSSTCRIATSFAVCWVAWRMRSRSASSSRPTSSTLPARSATRLPWSIPLRSTTFPRRR